METLSEIKRAFGPTKVCSLDCSSLLSSPNLCIYKSGIIWNTGYLKKIRKTEAGKALIWGFELKVDVLPWRVQRSVRSSVRSRDSLFQMEGVFLCFGGHEKERKKQKLWSLHRCLSKRTWGAARLQSNTISTCTVGWRLSNYSYFLCLSIACNRQCLSCESAAGCTSCRDPAKVLLFGECQYESCAQQYYLDFSSKTCRGEKYIVGLRRKGEKKK